jgi:hypothetical protein
LTEELEIQAEMLRQTGYLSAAEWCKHIREHLDAYSKHSNDLIVDVERLLGAFKDDFIFRVESGNIDLRKRCLEVVQVLTERAIQNDGDINKTLKELLPYNDRALNANKVVYKMDKAFERLDDSLFEIQLYGSLFTFMLHVDGQYFPALKILCALKLAGEKNKRSIKYIESLNLDQMENILGKFGAPIFVVYNSDGRHLRNAIAHSNFTFDKDTLFCWDKDQRNKTITWQRNYSIYELSAVINDLKSVEHAVVTWSIIRWLAEVLTKRFRHCGLTLKFKYFDESTNQWLFY